MNHTYSKLICSAENLQSCFIQLMLFYVLLDVIKVFRP